MVGYHATNIILHILVALCLFWFLTLLYGDWRLSLLTSLLFVVHPLHTEAVSYISGRADPLALVCMLSGFIFYIIHLRDKRLYSYLIMIVSYTLALLSRENSLIFPVLLLFYHYSFREKVSFKKFLPVAGITIMYIVARLTFLKAVLPEVTVGHHTLLQRIPGFFVAFTNYIRFLLLPTNLHMEYGNPVFSITHPQALGGMILLSALLLYVFKKRNSHTIAFFGLGWFIITLIPVSNIYPLNAYMAEHWLYVPSIGFFLIVANFAVFLITKYKHLKNLLILLIIGVLCLYTYLTLRQNMYWREPIAFYQRTLEYAPQSVRAYYNLGNEYERVGDYEEAVAAYTKAVELNPHYAQAHYNLANTYRALNKNQEAINSYKNAVLANPQHAKAYYNLANTYKSMKQYEEAITSYQKAIAIKPDYIQAYNNLGSVYIALGKNQEAIDLFTKIIQSDPRNVYAYTNLGNAYFAESKTQQAIEAYRQALDINPQNAKVHNNLAILYYELKEYNLAFRHYQQAIKLGQTPDPAFLELLKSH